MQIPAQVQATAYLAAAGRAEIDPYARLFLGGLGSAELALAERGRAEVVARTHLMDSMLLGLLGPAVTVLNLGAGLCARPYRLDLSPCREVVEVDAEPVLAFKTSILSGYETSCPVRRIAGTSTALPSLPAPAVVLTEGLLVYLSPAQLAGLATALATAVAQAGQVDWLADIVSADSAAAMAALAGQAGKPLPLAGLESLAVFEEAGWQIYDYRPLPTPRLGRAGRSSRDIVDGVVHLRRPAMPG